MMHGQKNIKLKLTTKSAEEQCMRNTIRVVDIKTYGYM